MKTAGVVLDFYDDPNGALLKNVFPTPQDLHETIKTAHILNEEERDVLRDEAYALVLANEGKLLRKFACVDAGNTLLSCIYFEQTADALPQEAVKVAAANLASFCEDFGFEPTDFVKMAAVGAQRGRDPLRQPIVGDEADWASRTNLVSVRGGADSGRVIPTANQMKTAAAAPTVDHMVRARMDEVKEHGHLEEEEKEEEKKQKEKKSASIEERMGGEKLTDDQRHAGPKTKQPHLQNHNNNVSGSITKKPSDDVGGVEITGENRESTQWAKVSNIVDVTGQVPVQVFEKKASKHSALRGRFSLDAYADVKEAMEYFTWNQGEMTPADRHEFCVKTAARAEDLGLEVPELMQRYGSTGYSDDVDLHINSRKSVVDEEWHPVLQELKEKRASIAPDEFAKILSAFDEKTGLNWYYGGELFDPYFSTFGGGSEKSKKASAIASWDWQNRVGDRVTAEQLQKLARNGRGWLKKTFDHDLVKAFQKDPITIFESLPEPQKQIIARLANDEFTSLADN